MSADALTVVAIKVPLANATPSAPVMSKPEIRLSSTPVNLHVVTNGSDIRSKGSFWLSGKAPRQFRREPAAIENSILTVEGDLRMPVGKLHRRMTVVRLRDRRLIIFSAIALDEDEMRTIEEFGVPSFLIVPNDRHRLDTKIGALSGHESHYAGRRAR